MSFEYVQLHYENGQNQALICDKPMLGPTLNYIINQKRMEPEIRLRAPLSDLLSQHFEYLNAQEQPRIKFPVQSVRLAISAVIEDGERLGQELSRAQQRPHKNNATFDCPPGDVDDALKWILQKETFEYRFDGDAVLVGAPDDMYRVLVAILESNVNYQLKCLFDAEEAPEEGYENF